MFALMVVHDQPRVKIRLQFPDRAVDILADRDLIKLAQDRPVEPPSDRIDLAYARLGAHAIHIIYGHKRLIRNPGQLFVAG